MKPRDDTNEPEQDIPDAPGIEQQDWDAIRAGEIVSDESAANGDFRPTEEVDGDLPEEDDDNPYQESDEALPDDSDESILSRNPSKESGRFDEV